MSGVDPIASKTVPPARNFDATRPPSPRERPRPTLRLTPGRSSSEECYETVIPPSTAISAPVTADAAGEQSQAMAAATSLGSRSRPIGCCCGELFDARRGRRPSPTRRGWPCAWTRDSRRWRSRRRARGPSRHRESVPRRRAWQRCRPRDGRDRCAPRQRRPR